MTGHAGPMGTSLSFHDDALGIYATIRRDDLHSDGWFDDLHAEEITPEDIREFFPDATAIVWKELKKTFGRSELFGTAGEYRINLVYPGDGSVTPEQARQTFLDWLAS